MNKKLVISLIGLVISVALAAVFIPPLYSSVQKLRGDISAGQRESASLEELLSETRQLSREYEQMGAAEDKFYQALPQEKDIPQLLVQFENLAAYNGLLLESISFEEALTDEEARDEAYRALSVEPAGLSSAEQSGKSSFNTISISVDISGTYDAFKNYLNALENSVRSMNVYFISFSAQDQSEGALGTFAFKLGISVYYAD